MNRSYSKIRHIQESNLKLEQVFIKNHISNSKEIVNEELPYYPKVEKTGSNLPLHYYAALKFAKLETTSLTEKDLKQSTINTLSDILCEKSKRMKTCNPELWGGKDPKGKSNKNYLGYLDYSTLYPKSPSYDKTLTSSSFTYNQPQSIQELMLTLGQAGVYKDGNKWVVYDDYNFDNIQKSKPHLSSKILAPANVIIGGVKALYGWITGQSPAAGAEEVLTQLHNFGYKGFKTKLNIPIKNCFCGTQKPNTDKPTDKNSIYKFQNWVVNTKKDKQILGKSGADGIWGYNSQMAWDKYKNDYNKLV